MLLLSLCHTLKSYRLFVTHSPPPVPVADAKWSPSKCRVGSFALGDGSEVHLQDEES
jgi:hypothetical protein